MKDDDFTGIVRSGSQHSVSVSEHTGNAKTPKNVVTSHEEETASRKLAFEQNQREALNTNAALEGTLTRALESIAESDNASAKLEKIKANTNAENKQTLASGASASPNKQAVDTASIKANTQTIKGDKGIAANVQDVSVDVVAANLQSVSEGQVLASNVQDVSIDVVAANRQSVEGDPALIDNLQNVAADGAAPNVQGVAVDNLAANKQPVTGTPAVAANQQSVATDAVSANRQDIPTDALTDNVQGIPVAGVANNQQTIATNTSSAHADALPTETSSTNRQGLPNDAATANVQGLAKEGDSTNAQPIGAPHQGSNRASLPPQTLGKNEQQVPGAKTPNNTQALPNEHNGTNRAGIDAAPALPPNQQPLEVETASLNRQATPEDAPPGINRQGVDQEKIEDHFEPLPSGKTELSKVDFGTETSSSGGTTSKAIASTAMKRPVAKPASPTTPRPALSAQAQQEAKQKRDKLMDEFHGRVAGIKHNVEELNHRLSDFEEQVHKEDAKLEKGDPNKFKVDLG